MNILLIFSLFLFFLSPFAAVWAQTTTPTESTDLTVWAEDALTWVFKTDPAKSTTAISLYTAKREYESFQIVVKAPAANTLTGVNVSVSDLVGPNGARVTADNITLYREYYVHTGQGSAPSNGSNRPLGPGWYPDGLIPFTDLATHQDLHGTLDAAPFTIPAGENQPIFVDIFTPPQTPTGQYSGTATVTSGQGTKVIQINLTVWNFTLPLLRSLHSYTQLDYSGSRNTLTNYKELLVHRFNPAYVDRQDQRYLMDNYGLDRVTAYNWSHSSYRHCTPIDPAPAVTDVQNEVANNEPGLYLYDSYANEVWPCTTQFPLYMDWAKNLRSGGIHPDIVMYPVPSLMGAAPDYADSAGDVWSVLPKHYDQSQAQINALIAKGVEVWSYNPLTQDTYSPKQTLDYLPINSRILHGFINQSLNLTGTKMWRVDYWSADPWNNKDQYNSETGEQAPGEGDITYRGDDVGLPNQIIPGMRMTWFREGSEDYEYIQLLKNAGQENFALPIIQSVGTDFHTWTQDKNILLAARKQLGDKLSALSIGLPTPTATASPGNSTCSLKARGDADCDNHIKMADFEIWRREFTGESSEKTADFNKDNHVLLSDFTAWSVSFHR